MPVSSRLAKITPAMAERWLEGNVLNRKIKDKIVKFYADQMARGLWLQNGSTLVFASDGTLLDGQHRLWACIDAKVPFTTLVAEGIDKASFSTIDTGASRTAGDVVNIAGYKQASAMLAGAAQHIITYKKCAAGGFKTKVPRTEVLKFVQENPPLRELVTIASSIKSPVRKHAAVVTAICFMAEKKYPQQVRNFLRKFMTGEELTAKSPILILRNRFIAEINLRPQDRLTLTANAWNAYVDGKQISSLKLSGNTFPKINGA